MRTERKKYWQEGGKWFCETSWFLEDIQAVTTAVVKEVAEDEVPPEYKAAPALPSAPTEAAAPVPLAEAAAPLAETLLPFGDAAAVIGATSEKSETP